jgi:hypothetical protein
LLTPEEGKTLALDERSRHALHSRLEEILGPDEAATLMEHLPPAGWADVATKRDLDHLEAKIRADFRGELIGFQRNIIAWTTGLDAALVGLVFAAAKLT